jgi:hypothetical protein
VASILAVIISPANNMAASIHQSLIPLVSILLALVLRVSILVASTPVRTPLSDAHHLTAPGTLLAAGCTRIVKLLVPWTDLPICRHDLWLPWVPRTGLTVVVAHGGEEEEDGIQMEGTMCQAGTVEIYRIHSPIFLACILSCFMDLHAIHVIFVFSRHIACSTAPHMLYLVVKESII